MKKLLILCIAISVGNLLYAQGKSPAVLKKAVVSPSVRAGKLSRYNGARGGVMGVNYYLQSQHAPTPLPVTKQRTWWEQQKRNWKARQFHQQRRERELEAQLQEQTRLAREAKLAKLPKANPSHQFTTQHFAALHSQTLPAEELPLLEEAGTLYRGMALPTDGKAVENILKNGLRLADVGNEANTRSLAVAGAMPGAGRILAKTPVTNLTSFPAGAVTWAGKRITDEKTLIAIVAVSGQTQSGEIVQLAHDIPAHQITHLLVPLTLNGTPVWCNVQLAPEGGFLITPYDIIPPAK